MTELRNEGINRREFLGFGALGAIVGTVLTIPPAAFVLSPIVKTNILGRSDVSADWQEVGLISEVPENEPKIFYVEFPIAQAYEDQKIQEKSGIGGDNFTVREAIWVSWRREILLQSRQGSGGDKLGRFIRPAFMDQKSAGFTEQERKEIEDSINVLSNSCAHLGCPVRWVSTNGDEEFLCPCHGGIYDISGGWVGGPPPRGMYRYTQV